MKLHLGRAIAIAVEAHKEQKDRFGVPYVLHPLRVMARVNSEAEKIVAILHDVVEDSDWTLARLTEEGFPSEVVHAIDCLTKREGEPYDNLIKRAASDAIARRVKIADLEDNMDLRRLADITPKDAERLNKYLRAWRYLNGSDAPPA